MVRRQGRRRLTLAPSTRRALVPSPGSIESEDEDEAERRAARGRAELSLMVEKIAEESHRPKPVHAPVLQAEPIRPDSGFKESPTEKKKIYPHRILFIGRRKLASQGLICCELKRYLSQVYSLQFKIEEENPTGEPQVIDMDSTSEEDPKEKENEGDDPKDSDTIGKVADGKMDVDGARTGTPKGDKQKASETDNANNKTVVLLPQQEAAKIILQSDSGVKDNTSNGGVASPGRSSKRNVSIVDQDSLEKASRLKASKNLETPKNKASRWQRCI